MFSLAGIPPIAGFWAKWYVFLAAINAGLYPLAIIGVLASVVGAYYYLRIIKIMWFDEPVGGFLPMAGKLRIVLGLSGAFVLFYVLPRSADPIGELRRSRRQDLLLGDGASAAPTAIAAGYRLEAHDSGRLDQRDRAGAGGSGDAGKLWIVSKKQESGRGRRGRAWATPEGNLAATLLLVETCELEARRDARLRRRAWRSPTR